MIFLVTNDLTKRSENEIKREGEFALNITKKFLKNLKVSYQDKLSYIVNDDDEFIKAYKESPEALSSFLKQKLSSANFTNLQLISTSDNQKISANGEFSIPDSMVKKASSGEIVSSIIPDDNGVKILVAVPIIGGGVKPRTIMTGVVNLNMDFLDPIKNITDMEVSIFSKDGKSRVATTMMGAISSRLTKGKVKKEIIEKLKTSNLQTVPEEWFGKKYIVVYSPLKNENKLLGYLSISISIAFFKKTNSIIIKYLYGVGIISLILAILVGYILSVSIANPLKYFAQVADSIADGNFDSKIDLERSDEIGYLAKTFNNMTAKLKLTMNRLERRMFEISTLYSVSQSMNFMNNSDQLLRMILDKAVEALKAEKGSIMLINSDVYELEVSVISGYKGEMTKRITIKAGEGLAGIAFETLKTQYSNDVENDDRFKTFIKTENDKYKIHNMLCVPLKIKDKPLGVINIINKKNNEDFVQDDISLMEALSTQAAITIENAKLYELSITDGMTKLYIHRYFQIRLDEELKRASRYGEEVSLIMCDVDHFKNFNDTYGHQTGDVVLIKYAEIMRQAIRMDVDIPCRYGGEEFIVIAPNTGKEEACVMAERLRQMVEEAEMPGPNGEILKVTISLGVSTYPHNTTIKKDLILKADTALYYSKENGRNQYTHISDVES